MRFFVTMAALALGAAAVLIPATRHMEAATQWANNLR